MEPSSNEFDHKHDDGAVLLVFHGNRGNADLWANRLEPLLAPTDRDPPVFRKIFVHEYPGYGNLYGHPDVFHITKDVILDQGMEALEEVLRLHPNHRVFLMGISLGSGVACEIAARCPDWVSGLILVTPYLSVAKVIHPWLSWFIWDNYSCEEWISKCSVRIPIFIVGGKHDSLTPFWHAERLFGKAPEPSRASLLPYDGGHNDAFQERVRTDWWPQVCLKIRYAPI